MTDENHNGNSKTKSEMISILKASCDECGSQGKWAEKHGINKASVSLILAGHIDMTDKIANALGYIRTYTFTKI